MLIFVYSNAEFLNLTMMQYASVLKQINISIAAIHVADVELYIV